MSSDLESVPNCYGEFWDYPKEDTCKKCLGQPGCFEEFVDKTYRERKKQLGADASIVNLAKALDISQEAVLLADNRLAQLIGVGTEEPSNLEDAGSLEDESVQEPPEELEEPQEELEEPQEELEEPPEELEEPSGELEGPPEELEKTSGELEGPPEELEEPPEELEEPSGKPCVGTVTFSVTRPGELEEPSGEPSGELEEPFDVTKSDTKKTTKKQTEKATTKTAASKQETKTTTAKGSTTNTGSQKKKRGARKTPPPPPVSSEDPTQAGSAQTVAGPANAKARKTNVQSAREQEDPSTVKGTGGAKKVSKKKSKKKAKKGPVNSPPKGDDGHVEDPWGQHTWEPRYLRERARSKEIKALRPGMKIKREYRKEVFEVKVLTKFYKFQGKTYPTLYSIVKEITGTKDSPRQLDKKGKRPEGTRQLCAWSAVRFFNLKASNRKR